MGLSLQVRAMRQMSGVRHNIQRSNRVRLKADAVVLLDRIVATIDDLRLRLQARQTACMRTHRRPCDPCDADEAALTRSIHA